MGRDGVGRRDRLDGDEGCVCGDGEWRYKHQSCLENICLVKQ